MTHAERSPIAGRPAARPVARTSRATTTGLLGLLLVSLFFTGMAGLMYQLVWFRLLGLIFGVTSQASSAVLAAFMGGLALGSFLASWLGPRLKNPIRAYGVAELAIGLFGFASLWAFDALQPLYRAVAMSMMDNLTTVSALRFVLAFAIMLIPTTLMGATLPFLLSAPAVRAHGLDRRVSLLYALNTFGAIAGAGVAGFALIGLFGLTVTTAIAAGFNIVVGGVWLVLGASRLARVSDAPTTGENHAVHVDPTFTVSRRAQLVVLVAYGFSGFCALAYEVVWTRVFATIFPGTVYAFATMLCCTLAGIAIGSWLISYGISRRANWLVVFAVLEVAMAVTAVLSFATISQVYVVERFFRDLLNAPPVALLSEPWFLVLVAMASILPTTILMGVTFPVAAKIFAAGHPDPGNRVGIVYGVNTVGGIVGSLTIGLALMPAVGAQTTLWTLAAINLVCGLAPMLVGKLSVVPRLTLLGASVAAVVAAVLVTPNFYQRLFATNPLGERTIWYEEGVDATVRVAINPNGNKVLYINSVQEASDQGGAELQSNHRLSHIGPLLHPNARDFLFVGLGAGLTVGPVALYPNTTIRAVELSGGAVTAGRMFGSVNLDLYDRPNVTFEVNDGRNHLLLSNERYDIIMTDTVYPTNAGSGNLYSVEYFRMVRDHLRDDGFMIMWLEMGLPEYAYKMMVRSFLTVFPESTLWYNGNVIVGSKQPIRIDRQTIAPKFALPGVKESLASIGFRDVNDVLREYVAGPDELREYVGAGPVLTDRHPAVEYFRTLPASGQAPDLRWRNVARFVQARETPDDAIVFGSKTVADLFGYFHPRGPAEYVAPVAIAGQEAPLESLLNQVVAKHPRVWFVPAWTYDTDIFVENWLDKHGYKVVDQSLGNLRAMLYVNLANEPAMRPFAINYADTLQLSGVGIDTASVPVGEVVRFRIRIDALDDLDEAYKVLIKLVDANGRVAATRDYTPRTPTTIGWRERTNVLNRVGLLVPAGTPPGAYSVELAMYHVATGQPLKPLNPNARGDRVIVGQLTVTAPTRTFLPEAVNADVLPGWMVGNAARVAGYSLDSATRRPGDLTPVTIFWQGVTGAAAGSAQVIIGDPANPVGVRQTDAGGALPVGAIVREDLAVRIRPGTASGRYDVWFTDRQGPARLMGTVWVAPGATLPTPAPPAQTINAKVGDVATLVGATTRRTTDGLDVQLVWRAEREVDQNYFVFVQVLSGGAPIAQSDQSPAKGLAPTTAWVPGQLIGDQHTLTLRAIPPGASLIVGLFDPVTFRRLPIGDRDYVTLPLP